jgi:hypothetical protein
MAALEAAFVCKLRSGIPNLSAARFVHRARVTALEAAFVCKLCSGIPKQLVPSWLLLWD